MAEETTLLASLTGGRYFVIRSFTAFRACRIEISPAWHSIGPDLLDFVVMSTRSGNCTMVTPYPSRSRT
jgi:hypothetical protein